MSNSFLYANNAGTVLGAPINNSTTTITLATGTGALFPSPSAGQQFVLSLTDAATKTAREITYCTSRTGDVCTVLRAQEGTSGLSWLAGDIAANLCTAGTMEELQAPTSDQVLYSPDFSDTDITPQTLTILVKDNGVAITSFGAVAGDTGAAQDNTTAFRKALASGAKKIFIPGNDDEYYFDKTVASGDFMLFLGTRDGLEIYGDGDGCSVLKLIDSIGRNPLFFGASSGSGNTLNDVLFHDFTLDCNGQNNLQTSYADPYRYNNPFYFFCKCTNLTWENIGLLNIAGSQGIRVGDDTLGNFGSNIQIRNPRVENFGIGIPGNLQQDVSVFYIEADKIIGGGGTYENSAFSFDLARGQTVWEIHGVNSTKIDGGYYKYVQLPALCESSLCDNIGMEFDNATLDQCNYIFDFDGSAGSFAQGSAKIRGNIFKSNVCKSALIQVGDSGESSLRQRDFELKDNDISGVYAGVVNANQGTHIISCDSGALRKLTIGPNNADTLLGSLLNLNGTISSGGLDIDIFGGVYDSLGATGGSFPNSPAVVSITPSATLNSLNIQGSTLLNSAAKNYSALGAFHITGTYNYLRVFDIKNQISSVYPLLTGSRTINNYEFIDYNYEIKTPYLSASFSLASSATSNLTSFGSITGNNYASYRMSIFVTDGTNNGVADYDVLYTSTGDVCTKLSDAGNIKAAIGLAFSGSNLVLTNAGGSTYTFSFAVTQIISPAFVPTWSH